MTRLDRIAERAAEFRVLDGVARPVARILRLAPRPIRDVLHGVWLGMPLHPMLTDVTIGAWTASFLLDLVGGRSARPASRRLVGLGVVSALPTAMTGAADWSQLNAEEQRIGAVHAGVNSLALVMYVCSYRARLRDRHAKGVAYGLAGATVASLGAHLGGALVFRHGSGVSRAVAHDVDSKPVRIPTSELGDALSCIERDGEPVLVASVEGVVRAVGDRCTHLGGPLHEGERIGGCVRCPWHGSEFRLVDGSVVHGPATAPLTVFAVERAPE